MLRPDLMEAYARRLIAALGSELKANVVRCSHRRIDHLGEEGGEWTAHLENGTRIKLQAVIVAPEGDARPFAPSPEELRQLRELGISS